MRKEKDFLGELEIQDDAYYGVQTTRALTNFQITGQVICPEMIKALACYKWATVKANMSTGRMPEDIGKALCRAAEEIIDGKLHDQFVTDPIQGGAGTSINMNINEVLCNRALEIMGHERGRYDIVNPNDHANMGQSTNDVVPCAIHITANFLGKTLIDEFAKTEAAFRKKAEEFKTVIKMGRTHLQDAVPITLGQEFNAYANVCHRCIERLEVTLKKLCSINAGATSVGTGINADPEYIGACVKFAAEITGLPLVGAVDLIDATQMCDEVCELSSQMKTNAFAMIKIANDLRLMASGPKCGWYEIKLPARQPGSSIMPGKVNPVMAEQLNQVCYRVIGNDLTTSLAVENGQMDLNVMEPVMCYALFESEKIMANSLRLFRELCVVGIEANVEHCKELVENSFGIMTAMLPHIGYYPCSITVKEAVATDTSVRKLIIDKGLVTEEEMNIILDPVNMTSPGIVGKHQINELRKAGKKVKSICPEE